MDKDDPTPGELLYQLILKGGIPNALNVAKFSAMTPHLNKRIHEITKNGDYFRVKALDANLCDMPPVRFHASAVASFTMLAEMQATTTRPSAQDAWDALGPGPTPVQAPKKPGPKPRAEVNA